MGHPRPLVVLHVLEDLETGGAERQLTDLILRSDVTRFHHEVCVLSEAGRFATELLAANLPVHILGVAPGKDLIRSVVRLWQLVRTVEPDILHATLYRPGIVSRLVGRLCGRPVVTTLVNVAYEPEWRLDNPHLTPSKVWIAQAVDRLTAKWWGSAFVAISDSVKTSAIRQLRLSADKISVIPRGVTADGYPEPQDADIVKVRAAMGWAQTYPLILNVGRLVPQKGQRYAILAMRKVASVFPNARLIIAGEGWLRPTLEHVIRAEGLETHVTLLGERKDVDALLRVADIFVFPSLFEGLGVSLIEAMAAAKPCIVSRISTMREVTGDGTAALLADPQSPRDLAEKLLRVAENRELATQMGRAAHAWVRERYDIQASVNGHEALYQQLVPTNR